MSTTEQEINSQQGTPDHTGNNAGMVRQKKPFTPLHIPAQQAVYAAGRPPSRFSLFVHLYNNVQSKFPGGERKFTYRGDKYEEKAHKQLQYLLNLIQNYGHTFHVAQLTDNSLPKDDGQRMLLKRHKGIVTVNNLENYPDLLTDYPVPSFLKQQQP
jgi:hypothetical protein